MKPDEIQERLSHLDGWSLVENGNAIRRTFTLPGFRAALAFIQFAGEVAESQDHHPDIDLRYRKVTLTLCTHSAGSTLTEKDFDYARALDGQ